MKYIIFFCSILFFFSCAPGKQENNKPANQTDTTAAWQVTVLDVLPDSLKPKIIALDSMPKPRLVTIPNHHGLQYSITNARGEITKLDPPIRKMLPVLQDTKGEPVKDSTGNTFVMGNGGLSHFTNFTSDDGLALDVINCSKTDKTGNIWFGTRGNGVSRYDGNTFTTFSTDHGLAGNSVLCIMEDRNGHLWFGTGLGVSRYDGRTFTNFSTAQGLPASTVLSIVEDRRGNIWLGTDGGGVSRYDGKTFTTFSTDHGLVHNTVLSMAEDRTGALWLGTDGGGVSRYDDGTFINFTTAQGLAGNIVWSIAEDRNGNIWLGTIGNGLSRYDGKAFTTFSAARGLAANSILSIVEDRTGVLWFGSLGGGVSWYDGRSFSSFSVAQGLVNNNVTCITEDRNGNMWFGTRGGIGRYDGRSFVSFSAVQGLAGNIVFGINEDTAGNLWFGTYGSGVSLYDGKSFTTFTTAQGLPANTVFRVARDKKGNIWLGTLDGGVCCYDGKSFTTFSTDQGLANNSVLSIAEDRTGTLWFGTYGGGVSCYNGRTFTNFSTKQGLAGNTVWSMVEDKNGNMWLGTQGGGLSRYDGRAFMTLSAEQGLGSNTVFSIAEDKYGNLWLGTDKGLKVLSAVALAQPDVANKKPIKTFSVTDGLPDSFVTQVVSMPDGKIAIGTNNGIALLTPSEDLTSLKEVKIYNSKNGYPVRDINAGQNCMFLDSKGFVWAGTGSEKTALVRFEPAALPATGHAPVLLIKSIKVNEENIVWYDIAKTEQNNKRDSNITPAFIWEEIIAVGRTLTQDERDSMKRRFTGIQFDSISHFYPVPANLVLPYKYNRITINFGAIETGKPHLLNYRYMLEGYDKNWSSPLKTTSATFGNIREGHYLFKVKVQGPGGEWTEPVTYSFTVLPPWYRTWWAYSLYIGLFLLMLRIFGKWRERKLLREVEKLEKTVTVRTAEVVAEKKKSDDLLRNILPEEIAEEIKMKGGTTARHFDNVTVLFTDFVGFTTAGERMSPQELVDELHACFKGFDEIMGKYGVEKIKTVGDAYLAAAGLPSADARHAENIIQAAIEVNSFMRDRALKQGDNTFRIRIGVHSGTVVAGIVGVKKFAYDIWGDAVNTAARMEQNSEAGKINISDATYQLVKEKFTCTYRGEIEAKNKGKLRMYFVEDHTGLSVLA